MITLFSNKKSFSLFYIFFSFILIYTLGYFFLGEKVYDGFGIKADQDFYTQVVRQNLSKTFNQSINEYQFQRILPSVFLNILLRVLSIEPTIENAAKAYELYSIFLTLCIVVLWFLIAKKAQLSYTSTLIGYMSLLLNSAILKIYPYQSINTDSTAYLIGLCFVYAYISNNKKLLLLLSLLCTFVWPIGTPIILLTLIMRETSFDIITASKRFFTFPKIPVIISLVLSFLILLAVIMVLIRVDVKMHTYGKTVAPVIWYLLPISLMSLFLYLYLAFLPLFRNISIDRLDIKKLLSKIDYKYLILGVIVIFISQLIVYFYASHTAQKPLTLKAFWINIAISSVTRPLTFLVAHISYFGPVLFLFLFFWRHIAAQIKNENLGLLLLIIIHIIQSICAESRQMIFIYPFFIFILSKSISNVKFNKFFIFLFLFLSLLYSRFWYTINASPFPENNGTTSQQFPLQHFFMFNGAWISYEVYLVMLSIFIVSGVVLYYTIFLQDRPKFSIEEHQKTVR